MLEEGELSYVIMMLVIKFIPYLCSPARFKGAGKHCPKHVFASFFFLQNHDSAEPID